MRLVSARDWARSGGVISRPRRRVVGVAAAAAALVLVAGCHVFGTSSAAGPTGSGTVTVAATPGVADAPLYIGIKDGLFSQAGITVHVVAGSSVGAEVSALKAGKVDVAFGDYADFFYAQQMSPDLNIVANGYDAAPGVMEVLTLPSSHITSPAGLAGKTIGTAGPQEMSYSTEKPYSEETLATWSVLSSDNVKPTSVRWQTMQTSSLVSALQNHQVDAILATEPTIYAAESQLGAIPVLDSCTGATANLPLAGYFSSTTYAKKNAANLAAFRAALLKAQAHAGMAAPVQSALQHYAGLQVETASLVTLGTYPTSLQEADLQRVANIMFNLNAEPTGGGSLSVSSMIDR